MATTREVKRTQMNPGVSAFLATEKDTRRSSKNGRSANTEQGEALGEMVNNEAVATAARSQAPTVGFATPKQNKVKFIDIDDSRGLAQENAHDEAELRPAKTEARSGMRQSPMKRLKNAFKTLLSPKPKSRDTVSSCRNDGINTDSVEFKEAKEEFIKIKLMDLHTRRRLRVIEKEAKDSRVPRIEADIHAIEGDIKVLTLFALTSYKSLLDEDPDIGEQCGREAGKQYAQEMAAAAAAAASLDARASLYCDAAAASTRASSSASCTAQGQHEGEGHSRDDTGTSAPVSTGLLKSSGTAKPIADAGRGVGRDDVASAEVSRIVSDEKCQLDIKTLERELKCRDEENNRLWALVTENTPLHKVWEPFTDVHGNILYYNKVAEVRSHEAPQGLWIACPDGASGDRVYRHPKTDEETSSPPADGPSVLVVNLEDIRREKRAGSAM
mmetsp:Transcript_359/g.815  ORF Transcript_359/g.815 Transcript_359/m.815 type:complete len:442 (+) Transcript_359:232-1557(+)